jgi:predicted phosphate transport protein (TIGR00153 family)
LAFPRQNEAQIRRTALAICQEQIRRTLEAIRELTNMIYDFSESNYKGVDEYLLNIMKLKEEAVEQKRLLLGELANSGMLLLNREDFLRLAVQIGEIADYCEGAAHRIAYISGRDMKISADIRVSMFNLSKNVLRTVTNLRETIFSLAFSRQKALDLAKNVEIAEYAVDELYRETEHKIIDSDMNFTSVILLRDLAQFLEDIADKAEDAIDSTRILALGV